MRRRYPLCVLLVVSLAACLGGFGVAPTPDGQRGPDAATVREPDAGVRATVTRVVDGDTVNVRFSNGSGDTVRLLGVDTPEVRGANSPGEFEGVPDTAAGRACLADAGETASSYARERLAGEEVRIVFDEVTDRRDYYGRLLAYVRVGGESFNRELLASGHARLYDGTFTERERYVAAERRAREEGRGLWACATPAGGDDAASNTTLAVVRVHADAEGRDGENLNDEYVVFRNGGGETLNLSGWTVSDEAGARYVVPEGTTLPPGGELTLYTGSGTDGDGARYWGKGRPVWNNDGDAILVRDPNGALVVERRF
ncbi:lamin tail domain-containing protein [Halopelagius longus]|uniref:Endonuclease n=1 Tax=Halopelagius longus TaxID=1236180 RepID=A0A1H1AS62_9EURY|nr:lamin tail domain-containing protein [Halopelagius longus]RDI70494.1 endonuclease [Halopelagius longus]SDQ42452.1 micrococcal nuclease [Halopelagius longus]